MHSTCMSHASCARVRIKSEPFPKRQILDTSKLKEFAGDNFKFDENGRKFAKRVENTGKGEIAHYEHFSFSLGVFDQKTWRHVKIKACLGKC